MLVNNSQSVANGSYIRSNPSDEDIDHETELHQLELKTTVDRARQAAAAAAADAAECAAADDTPQAGNHPPTVVGQHVRELLQQRRREERRAKRARQLANKQPQNLLFVDGHDEAAAATCATTDSISSDDAEEGDGYETEEEQVELGNVDAVQRAAFKSHIDEDELEYEQVEDVEAKRARLS